VREVRHPVGSASARGGGPAGRRGPVQVFGRSPEDEGTSPRVRPTQPGISVPPCGFMPRGRPRPMGDSCGSGSWRAGPDRTEESGYPTVVGCGLEGARRGASVLSLGLPLCTMQARVLATLLPPSPALTPEVQGAALPAAGGSAGPGSASRHLGTLRYLLNSGRLKSKPMGLNGFTLVKPRLPAWVTLRFEVRSASCSAERFVHTFGSSVCNCST